MKILMCTDGSPSAHEAVLFGGLIARMLEASVTLLAVSRSAEPEARAAEILRDCEPLLKGVEIRPHVMTRSGVPADEIIAEAEGNRYNLVVIGSHGTRGLTRFVMGSTAYQIVDHMPIDTLVVRGKRPALRRVLICTAAQMDERAVEVGGEWARAAGAEVTVLHVLTPLPSIYLGLSGMEEATEELLSTGSPAARHLDATLSRLVARGVKAQLAVRRGFMPDEVLAVAQR